MEYDFREKACAHGFHIVWQLSKLDPRWQPSLVQRLNGIQRGCLEAANRFSRAARLPPSQTYLGSTQSARPRLLKGDALIVAELTTNFRSSFIIYNYVETLSKHDVGLHLISSVCNWTLSHCHSYAPFLHDFLIPFIFLHKSYLCRIFADS